MIRDALFDFFSLNTEVETARNGTLNIGGRDVLDLLCQYGASPFGGTPPVLAKAIQGFFDAPNPILCQPLSAAHAKTLKTRLAALCGMEGGDVILTQSGAETVELAVKLAQAATGKRHMIALSGAFHGKTTAAVQLTANREYARYFGVQGDFVRRMDIGALDQLEADFARLTADKKVNAVLVEVLQGEGGMVEVPTPWLQRLRQLCRDADIMFIVDEIQTGLGRTGVMLASQDMGLCPDVVLLSKALGGGVVPIGACIMRSGLMPPDFTIFHSSTFSNNNFTAFVASRTLDLIEDTLPEIQVGIEALDQRLSDLVKRYPDVFSHASGRGLMRGLHLRETHDEQSLTANFQWNSGLRSYAIAAWLLNKQGILTMPCFSRPSCLRIQPPLGLSAEQIDTAFVALEKLAELLRRPGADLVLLGGSEPQMTVTPSPRPVRRPSRPAERRFQFNMHPLHAWSFTSSMPQDVDAFGAEARSSYLERGHVIGAVSSGFAATCLDIPEFRLGDTLIDGRLFGINLTADQMINLNARQRASLQATMATSAEDYGADVMGLGAFTSIITNPSLRRLTTGAVVTPGSSLTAYTAVEAALNDPPLTSPASFGVIGANGSVGGLCVQMLILAALRGQGVDRVVLLFNPKNADARRSLAKSLRRWTKAWAVAETPAGDDPFAWTGLRAVAEIFQVKSQGADLMALPDLFAQAVAQVLGRPLIDLAPSDSAEALAGIDRLLLATNATGDLGVLFACRAGAYIYDIGMPASVSKDWASKAPVTVRSAGLARLPGDWQFGHGNIVNLPRGVSLGCFAETITLAATDPTAAPSGPAIALDQACRIGALARMVGIEPTLCPLSDVSITPELSKAG